MSVASSLKPLARLALSPTRRTRHVLMGLGLVLAGASSLVGAAELHVIGLTVGTALVLLAALAMAIDTVTGKTKQRDLRLFAKVFAQSDRPCVLCDVSNDQVLWANAPALALYDITPGAPISTLLDGLSANPDALASRLQDLALAEGTALHDIRDGAEQRSYTITALSDTLALWQVGHHATTDPRDTLPLEIAQIAPDGTICYLSPGLRVACAGQSPDLGARILAATAGAGQVGTLNLTPEIGARKFLRVPEIPGEPETVLFLPDHSMGNTAPIRDATESTSLEQMPVALAHIGTDGRFTYLNLEARRLLRLRTTDNALLSDTLEGLGRPVLEWLSDVASGRLARATEVLRLNRSAPETYLKVTLTRAVNDPDAHVVAVIADVTELKSLEAKFTQSQKMQAIGQLAGGVAHDFNNLLTAISGHCDLLLLRHDRSDLDYPDLMQIQQNTNRAAALVRQLLALSRQQTLKFVTLDLTETMNDVIHLLNRLVGEKITLTLRHGEDVAPIRSDKRQFEQVLMNLVVNARDALPLGGEIRIETETRTLHHGTMRDQVHLPAGDYTIIRISDDGTGIPQSLLSQIFDPFFTTKRPGDGTGLGLSTVYGIIKQSGGFIFVDSEEGVGTTFTLYFNAQDPATAVAPAKDQKTSRLPAPALKTRRALVLLVEDEAPVRSFAARALELQGHRVIEADCGEAALEILDNPDIQPDFFITDVIMPGIDGPGWVGQVRHRFPDIPVLFVSGYAEDSRVAAQARISNAQFLGKPFSLAEFTTIVNAQLQRQSEAA